MFSVEALKARLTGQQALEEFHLLYGVDPSVERDEQERYATMIERYASIFGTDGEEPLFFSAPGRTEIAGNHTDHNNGRVLAAAVTLDTLALAAPNDTNTVILYSEGYEKPFCIDLNDLEKKEKEINTTDALIRGVCFKLRKEGLPVGGFNAYVTSCVLSGSGLSSSAAFEVMLVTVLDGLFGQGVIEGVERAKISQWVENEFFGKPSGLMDQSASSIGGLVEIDFKNPEPAVVTHAFDFDQAGFTVVVLAVQSSHADLTNEYASIPQEMKSVAAALGGHVLRDCTRAQLLDMLPVLREKTSDRAVLRALHYFDENDRVKTLCEALDKGDLETFLSGVIASGESSWRLLQNLYVGGSTAQSLALACALSERLLRGRGAWRVHGGGFAGTILGFVPTDCLERYIEEMNAVFGKNACTVLGIRPVGAKKVAL